MKHNAFTMVELIFVIVIIGVLASVAIPKLSGVTDSAKKSAEIATISAVATAIESANGEWSINEGDFTWGNHQIHSDESPTLNSHGYPTDLNASGKVFGRVIKGNNSKFENVTPSTDGTDDGVLTLTCGTNENNISIFKGPASNINGLKFTNETSSHDIPNKPDKNDFWVYASYIQDSINGFNITCTQCNQQTVYSGDFVLIDVNETDTTLPTISCTP